MAVVAKHTKRDLRRMVGVEALQVIEQLTARVATLEVTTNRRLSTLERHTATKETADMALARAADLDDRQRKLSNSFVDFTQRGFLARLGWLFLGR